MQKKQSSWLLLIIFLGLIGLFILAYRNVHTPAVKNVPAFHTVLVVDFDQNQQLTEQDILSGKDAILVVKSSSQKDPLWFSSLSTLANLDKNKDGRLDSKDPIYPNMGLMFLNAQKQAKYLSLAEENVIAIMIDQKKINESEGQLLNEDTVGNVIMKDGTQRKIRFLKLSV